jgi:hypothetical protein
MTISKLFHITGFAVSGFGSLIKFLKEYYKCDLDEVFDRIIQLNTNPRLLKKRMGEFKNVKKELFEYLNSFDDLAEIDLVDPEADEVDPYEEKDDDRIFRLFEYMEDIFRYKFITKIDENLSVCEINFDVMKNIRNIDENKQLKRIGKNLDTIRLMVIGVMTKYYDLDEYKMVACDTTKQEIVSPCDCAIYHLRDDNHLVEYGISNGSDIPQKKFILPNQ